MGNHAINERVEGILSHAFQVAGRQPGTLAAGVVLLLLITNVPVYLIQRLLPTMSGIWLVLLYGILIAGAAYLGYAALFLKPARNQMPALKDSFSGFEQMTRAVPAGFLYTLLVVLWSIPYIIGVAVSAYVNAEQLLSLPLITDEVLIELFFKIYLLPSPLLILVLIAILRYSMVWYLLVDDPNLGALQAIRRSKQCMRGNKAKLFGAQFIVGLFFAVLMIGVTILSFLCALTGSLAIVNIVSYIGTLVAFTVLMLLNQSVTAVIYTKIQAQNIPPIENMIDVTPNEIPADGSNSQLLGRAETERENPLEFK